MGLSIPLIALPGRAAPVANCYGWIGRFVCDLWTPSGAGEIVLGVHYGAADANAWEAPIRTIRIVPGGVLVPANPTANVVSVSLANNVATLTTDAPHGFQVGASVNTDPLTTTQFRGNHTITAVTAYTFSFALTGANLATTADQATVTATQGPVMVSSLATIQANARAYAQANPGVDPNAAIAVAMYQELLKHPELVGSTITA